MRSLSRRVRASLRRASSNGPPRVGAAPNGPVIAHTPPVEWAYGAILDLPATEGDSLVAVAIEGWVTRGSVGIGICSEDGSEILDERRVTGASGSRPFRVELLSPGAGDARLVVRTADMPEEGEVIITSRTRATSPTAAEAWAAVPKTPGPWTTDWHLHFGTYADSLSGRVRTVDLASCGETVVVPWFGGTLELDPRAEITRAIAGSGTYEPGLLWALAQLVRPGDATVMAGANAGIMPAYLAHLVGSDGAVIAVEPSPREFAALERNVSRLASADAISPVRAALGAAPGTAAFAVAPAHTSGRGQIAQDGDLMVEVTTIDTLARERGRSISLIVLDLEGHEIQALEGAHQVIASDLPIIVAEIDGAASLDRINTKLAPHLRAQGYALLTLETGSGATGHFPSVPSGGAWALLAVPPRLQEPEILNNLMHRRALGNQGKPDWLSEDVTVSSDTARLVVTGPHAPWEYLAEWSIPRQTDAPGAHDVIEVLAHAVQGTAEFVVVDRVGGRIVASAAIPRSLGSVHLPLTRDLSVGEYSLVLRTAAEGGPTIHLESPSIRRHAPDLNPVLRSDGPRHAELTQVAPAEEGAINNFTDPLADEINLARLAWLESLHLDIDGRRIVDFGAGIGVFAPFFIDRGARYVGMEGRQANIDEARKRIPTAQFIEADLRRLSPRDIPADVDTALIFGLLYHLDDPRTLLDTLGQTGARLMVVETQVCDSERPVLLAEREPLSENQALDGRGSRPSVPWLLDAIRDAGFPCIASTGLPVQHRDFSYVSLRDGSWRRDGHNLRVAFIAARDRADIPAHLVQL